jgi:2-dehydropantoate 2-reductase
MQVHIAIVGAGAVGGYTGGRLAAAGAAVTLIDAWPAHVDAMRTHGLRFSGTQGDNTVRVRALHLCDVQQLLNRPVDIAIVSTKSYDTEWATALIAPYLARDGYVVSMQNGMNEERIARVVGWDKTVGCIASSISVNMAAPGHIMRTQQPGGGGHAVFRVGEVHGRMTSRATRLAQWLCAVDHAEVTDNLWGERWTKLATNAITHGLLGATGLDNRAVLIERGRVHRLGVRLAAEAVAVGRALGYDIGTLLGIEPDDWLAADAGDAVARQRVAEGLAAWMTTLTAPSRSSVGRDVASGRRTEIEFTNGLVAAKGEEAGVPAPTHAAVTALVRRIDRGELKPHPANVDALLLGVGLI